MRASPYAASYLILAVAIWSLTFSYMYNRHVNERTFWLLLLVFLLLEAFAKGYERAQQNDQSSMTPAPSDGPIPRLHAHSNRANKLERLERLPAAESRHA
jgi:hypothetical protein